MQDENIPSQKFSQAELITLSPQLPLQWDKFIRGTKKEIKLWRISLPINALSVKWEQLNLIGAKNSIQLKLNISVFHKLTPKTQKITTFPRFSRKSHPTSGSILSVVHAKTRRPQNLSFKLFLVKKVKSSFCVIRSIGKVFK